MPAFRFIFMADCQLGAYATFSGITPDEVAGYEARGMKVKVLPPYSGFEWDADRYREAIAAANALRPSFVVMGGDMVDSNADPDQLDALREITAGLDPDIPMHWVPGNHDAAADALVPTAESLAWYREQFGPDRYTFDVGDIRFVVMNTVVLDHPEQVPDEFEEQMAFLDHTVVRADRRVVLLGHHPLFLADANEPDDYWNLPAGPRKRLLDLIHANEVPVGFAGHWHRNGIARDGGFEMVTSGPVGVPLGDDPSGFTVVDVDSSSIKHHYETLEVRQT